MSKKLTSFSTYGTLIGGKVVLDNPRYFKGMLKFYEDCKRIRVVVERVRGLKTQKQLGYLYGHLYEVMSAHTGMTVTQVDRAMKAKYLKDIVVWRGIEYKTVKDKRDLFSDECGEFIDEVYNEALEMGLEVETPDKEWRVKRDFPEVSESTRAP